MTLEIKYVGELSKLFQLLGPGDKFSTSVPKCLMEKWEEWAEKTGRNVPDLVLRNKHRRLFFRSPLPDFTSHSFLLREKDPRAPSYQSDFGPLDGSDLCNIN